MHALCECGGMVVVENGFRVCTSCGRTTGRHLETHMTSYGSTSLYFPVGYSRKSRFEKKVLGALRRLSAHTIDENLMAYLKERNIQTPEQLMHGIATYPTKGRRPYLYIMYYWVALGFKQPVVLDADMQMLKRDFDHIFFAWERLGFPNPKFPYSYTFTKLAGQRKYSQGMRDLIPFVRQLRCPTRRSRYDRLFKICQAFDFKKIVFREKQMESHKCESECESKCESKCDDDEVQYPATEIISHEKVVYPKVKDVRECRNVYQSQADVQRAFDTGTFDVAKTMSIDKDGKFYFLQWSKTPSGPTDEFKRNQQKLTELLKQQALI